MLFFCQYVQIIKFTFLVVAIDFKNRISLFTHQPLYNHYQIYFIIAVNLTNIIDSNFIKELASYILLFNYAFMDVIVKLAFILLYEYLLLDVNSLIRIDY